MSLQFSTRLQVIRGQPTAEEVIAVLLALDLTANGDAPRSAPQPPWQRAARLEALGGAPLASASDPRLALAAAAFTEP